MAYTKTSIISLSLMIMGHKPIQTLDNADDLTIAAEQAFDILLPSVLASSGWRFATTITQLSLSTQIPPPLTNWQNIYYLPSGYLKNVRIIPNNYVYEIYSNSEIWCNWGTETAIFMEYIFLPNIAQIPAYFINYFIWELASFLCLSNAQKPDFMDRIEKKRVEQFAMASAIDAQNRPQYSQVDIPVLNRRNITGIIGPAIG